MLRRYLVEPLLKTLLGFVVLVTLFNLASVLILNTGQPNKSWVDLNPETYLIPPVEDALFRLVPSQLLVKTLLSLCIGGLIGVLFGVPLAQKGHTAAAKFIGISAVGICLLLIPLNERIQLFVLANQYIINPSYSPPNVPALIPSCHQVIRYYPTPHNISIAGLAANYFLGLPVALALAVHFTTSSRFHQKKIGMQWRLWRHWTG